MPISWLGGHNVWRAFSAPVWLALRASAFLVVFAALLASLASDALPAEACVTLVRDRCEDGSGTPLAAHTPDAAPPGASWEVERGEWLVDSRSVSESSLKPAPTGYDYRAVINSGSPGAAVSAVVKRGNGAQLFGVVARYVGPGYWLMFFPDGVGDLILDPAPRPTAAGSWSWRGGHSRGAPESATR